MTKHMTDAPTGAKSRFPLCDRPKQLIGMQASLHQELGLPGADELDSLISRRLAMRDVDDLDAVDIKVHDFARLSIFPLGPTESGLSFRLERPPAPREGGLVAGMRDSRC